MHASVAQHTVCVFTKSSCRTTAECVHSVSVALPALEIYIKWSPMGKQASCAEAAALLGNWSGGAYWPSTFTGLPEDDEDPLVVQAYWAHNAAAGLDYVLEHRCAARPAPLPVQGLRAIARHRNTCSAHGACRH